MISRWILCLIRARRRPAAAACNFKQKHYNIINIYTCAHLAIQNAIKKSKYGQRYYNNNNNIVYYTNVVCSSGNLHIYLCLSARRACVITAGRPVAGWEGGRKKKKKESIKNTLSSSSRDIEKNETQLSLYINFLRVLGYTSP